MSATENPLDSNTESPTNANKDQPTTYTGIATSAAGTAAETATNAAVGVKDTMFSMFGGGGKKAIKDEKVTESEEDKSGSAKATKEKEKEKKDLRGAEEQAEAVYYPCPTLLSPYLSTQNARTARAYALATLVQSKSYGDTC